MKRQLIIIIDGMADANDVTIKPATPAGINILQDNDTIYLPTLSSAVEVRDALTVSIEELELNEGQAG